VSANWQRLNIILARAHAHTHTHTHTLRFIWKIIFCGRIKLRIF